MNKKIIFLISLFSLLVIVAGIYGIASSKLILSAEQDRKIKIEKATQEFYKDGYELLDEKHWDNSHYMAVFQKKGEPCGVCSATIGAIFAQGQSPKEFQIFSVKKVDEVGRYGQIAERGGACIQIGPDQYGFSIFTKDQDDGRIRIYGMFQGSFKKILYIPSCYNDYGFVPIGKECKAFAKMQFLPTTSNGLYDISLILIQSEKCTNESLRTSYPEYPGLRDLFQNSNKVYFSFDGAVYQKKEKIGNPHD